MAQPGPDIGLLFYALQAFSDFTLRLQFRVDARSDNSGVFVRFRDPRQPPPAGLNDPRIAGNSAWLAVDTGFEVQIDDAAQPDQADKHRTGAIYDVDIGRRRSGSNSTRADRRYSLANGMTSKSGCRATPTKPF